MAGSRSSPEATLDRIPSSSTVARLGLGLTILLAGLHKFVAPTEWDAYVLPWLADLLPMTVRTFTLANGVAETAVGLALLADRWTGLLAAVTALSLAGTTIYLGLAALLVGQFGALAVRDFGLLALATVVAVDRLGS